MPCYKKLLLLATISVGYSSLRSEEAELPPLEPHNQMKFIDKPIHTKVNSVTVHQIPVPASRNNSNSQPGSDGNSGYLALLDSVHFLLVPEGSGVEQFDAILSQTDDQVIASEFFSQEKSAWRIQTIEFRKKSMVKSFLEDHYLLNLSGIHEIPYQEISHEELFTAFIPQTKKCFFGLNHDLTQKARDEISYLVKLFPNAAEYLATQKIASEQFTISREELSNALEESSRTTKTDYKITFSKALIDTYLKELSPYKGTLIARKNHNELILGDKSVATYTYAPSSDDNSLDGSWLQTQELKNLAEREVPLAETPFNELVGSPLPIKFLEFSEEQSLEERVTNSIEFAWLRKELEKKPTAFTALFYVACNKSWFTCVIRKVQGEISLSVIDPYNIYRLDEKGIQQLIRVIDEGLHKKVTPPPTPSRPQPVKDPQIPVNEQDKNKEITNYDAPLAHLSLEELPTLERLFDDKIPNKVQLLIKRLKDPNFLGTKLKLKNCFLLVGPPGVGKSTIGQIIVRMAGWDIAFAGGGDFRTAFQGSGKAKVDALVAEAKKRGKCAVFIDELDAAAARLEPHGTTQEDNRALKALLTTIDQHMYDPNLCFICTSNYPEKMDPAILRRFTIIEIPLPEYEQRKKIIEFYLKEHAIPIEDRNPNAVSPYFLDKLITATKGFSGDAICDMINNAIAEQRAGLEPEHKIDLGFRCQGIDFCNKSLLSNLREISLLPWIPVFMCMKENDLDKHIYAQYVHHLKNRNSLKKRELENKREHDPFYRYAKEPYLKQIMWKLAERLEHRALDGALNYGINKIFRSLRMQNPFDPMSEFAGLKESIGDLKNMVSETERNNRRRPRSN